MKSFKEYLIENPILEPPRGEFVRPNIRTELPKAHSDLYSLGSSVIDGNEYHFHGYSSNKDSPFTQERLHTGYVTMKDSQGTHKVVGNTDFYPHDSEHNTYYSNFPKLNKEHTGKGLMSELYKRWADHNKYTLISGRVHTRGGKNIWAELSQKGTVTAHDTNREGSRPIVYDSNNPKHYTKFYTATRTSNPIRWLFKYKGK